MHSERSLSEWIARDPKAALVELDRADVAERGLRSFIQLGWHTVEGRKPFVGGWHIDAIAEHLEAVSRGQIRQLIINMPPRHMKSTQVSVMWPVWDWIDNPWRQWLFASYAQDLAIRDSVKCRRVLTSPWFQDRWGGRFSLTGDQNAKQRFENDEGGYRLVSSVDGKLTGEGGDIICIDDPHNVREADSDAVRTSCLKWWDEAMSTRLNDPQTGAYVIIMQRVHQKDLTGHILANEHGWDHLCLPAEYERGHPFPTKSSLGFKDPRKVDGDLLWPNRFGRKEIDKLKSRLKTKAPGQLQQRPSAAGGAILKPDHLQLWPHDRPLPRFHYVVQSWDTAETEKEQNDPTAFLVLGVFTMEDGRTAAMLCDVQTDHLQVPDLLPWALKEYRTEYGASAVEEEFGAPLIGPKRRKQLGGRKPDVVLIEDKSSGKGLRQALARQGVPVHPYNPGKLDKVARAHLITPALEEGLLWIPESARPDRKGKPRDWVMPLIDQMEAFPNGEHDDMVDTLTQALRLLIDQRFLVLEDDADATPEEPDEELPAVNPYAA